MMNSCSEKSMISQLCLIFFLSYTILVIASPVRHLCRPDQRDALWEFKYEFYIQWYDSDWVTGDNKTESWMKNTDCCLWDGVSCDPKTGRVVKLDLAASSLNGPLTSGSGLFRLQHLHSLNLNYNNFSGILPDSIGSLKNLRVLNLAGCSFFGKISSSLGNLSYLTALRLSGNDFSGELPDSMTNLNRLANLQLDDNKLSGNFPFLLLNLSKLNKIYLGYNQFKGMLPSNISSLSKLASFGVYENSFFGSIPSSLFMMPWLVYLELGRNHFSGSLGIENISSPSKLKRVSLGENNLNGAIPRSISNLIGLKKLDLSFWNTGRGIVDFNIFLHLTSLEVLRLSYLNTDSIVDLSLFSNLTSLRDLDLSGINLKISSILHFPPPIVSLVLSSCNISEFPNFLQNKTALLYLDISSNLIKGQVPEWLWRHQTMMDLNLSRNFFNGFEGSGDVIQKSALYTLDISWNAFMGLLPLVPTAGLLHFSGSNNLFTGEIPRTICESFSLETLDLSHNNFSGSIPQCFENFMLSVLHLQNNSLSGRFPKEAISYQLVSLDVGHNRLSGKLPKSLIYCTCLEFLNMEDNLVSDKFPFWLSSLPDLQVIVLRSNKFYGPISSPQDSLCFPKLRIFDISENHFTGVLASDYFAGWSAMLSVVEVDDHIPIKFSTDYPEDYHSSVALTNKGLKMELVGSVFTMYKTIDVSGNRLQGDIPESIGLLKELIVLNMSNKAFTGPIPPSLGNMTNLQSLDLSRNRLSGEIPQGLGQLTFLVRMNFSYNRFDGQIPQGTQIQSQTSSSFAENPGLCGVPLPNACGGGGAEESKKQEGDEEKEQVFSWIAAAIGYVFGVFCGFTIGHFLALV